MGNVVTIALIAVALFAVFWTLRSTPAQGQNVLQRWGIAKPTEDQGMIAADYLLQRRKIFPYMAIVVFGLATLGEWLFSPSEGVRWDGVLLFSVVASLLVAELIATLRRPTEEKRAATLTPRRFTDIVPRFGLVLLGIQALLIAGFGAATVAAMPFAEARNAWRQRHLDELQKLGGGDAYLADTNLGPIWFALLAFTLCVVAALCVVRLCQLRGPLTTDLAVDAALRIRSGRVALGTAVLLGSGFIAAVDATWWDMVNAATNAAELTGSLAADLPPVPGWILPLHGWMQYSTIAGILCLFGWMILISPWRTQRLVAANA